MIFLKSESIGYRGIFTFFAFQYSSSSMSADEIILTYLLTPWSRVLLEKLNGFAASQEIPRNYGTPNFINILTSARHLSLS
jgi:hypothetical protein